MSIDPKAVAGYLAGHPTAAGVGLVVALIVLVIVWRAGRGITHAVQRGLAEKRPEDVLTFVYSAMATAVAAEGMLKFFGDKLDMPVWMRGLTFCMFELGMLGCALRARRKIRDPEIGSAGIDGKLVWVMAGVSGVLASTAASGWGVLARIIIPLFAAGGWELLLAYERRRAGRSHIHWRVNFERVAVRLGLADPTGRTAGEVDTHRRITQLALAVNRLRRLEAAGASEKRLRRAERRLNAAGQAAVTYARLATDEERQEELMAQLAVLSNLSSLTRMAPVAPWEKPDPVSAVFESARYRFAPLIAGAAVDGTEQTPELDAGTGAEPPSKTGTPRRRKTGTRTGTQKRSTGDRATLVERARVLNETHVREHGKPISANKLVAELHVSKTTALAVLAEVKRPRAVPSDGAA